MIVRSPKFQCGGLNTRAETTGLPLLECAHLQELSVIGTDWVQRDGIVRVASFSGNNKALDLDGVDQDLSNTVDTRVWELGLYWTLEFAIEPDTTSGTMGLVTAGSTTPSIMLDVTGGNIRCRVWDSGASLTTVTVGAASTSTQTVQVTRSAATLSTRLDNGTAVTGTMSATNDLRTPVGNLYIGQDDSSNYFNGTFDYVRLFSTARSNHADRLVRNPCPRAENVLADYDMNAVGTLVYDRSRYENHLIVRNAPTEVTSLCHLPSPIRAIAQGRDENNKKQLLVCCGGLYYLCEVD